MAKEERREREESRVGGIGEGRKDRGKAVALPAAVFPQGFRECFLCARERTLSGPWAASVSSPQLLHRVCKVGGEWPGAS